MKKFLLMLLLVVCFCSPLRSADEMISKITHIKYTSATENYFVGKWSLFYDGQKIRFINESGFDQTIGPNDVVNFGVLACDGKGHVRLDGIPLAQNIWLTGDMVETNELYPVFSQQVWKRNDQFSQIFSVGNGDVIIKEGKAIHSGESYLYSVVMASDEKTIVAMGIPVEEKYRSSTKVNVELNLSQTKDASFSFGGCINTTLTRRGKKIEPNSCVFGDDQ